MAQLDAAASVQDPTFVALFKATMDVSMGMRFSGGRSGRGCALLLGQPLLGCRTRTAIWRTLSCTLSSSCHRSTHLSCSWDLSRAELRLSLQQRGPHTCRTLHSVAPTCVRAPLQRRCGWNHQPCVTLGPPPPAALAPAPAPPQALLLHIWKEETECLPTFRAAVNSEDVMRTLGLEYHSATTAAPTRSHGMAAWAGGGEGPSRRRGRAGENGGRRWQWLVSFAVGVRGRCGTSRVVCTILAPCVATRSPWPRPPLLHC